MSDAHSLDTLIQSLRRLPGVGVRSAQRMAFHLLQHDREGAQLLARSLHDTVAKFSGGLITDEALPAT